MYKQRHKKQKYSFLKNMSYPKMFAGNIFVFFLCEYKVPIFAVLKQPILFATNIVPSNIVFTDILRVFLALYRPE